MNKLSLNWMYSQRKLGWSMQTRQWFKSCYVVVLDIGAFHMIVLPENDFKVLDTNPRKCLHLKYLQISNQSKN